MRADRRRILCKAVEEVFDVDALFALDEELREIGHGVECEMPELHRVLTLVVHLGPREWAFAPADTSRMLREQHGIGVRDHAADIVADYVHLVFYPLVLGDETVQVPGHNVFCVAIPGFTALARAAVVGGEDAVAGVGEGRDDTAELVAGLGEAVDEQDGAFGGGGG